MRVNAHQVAVLLLVLALSACNKGGPPRIVGDRAILPPGCKLLEMAERQGVTIPDFYRFDGVYPTDWPPELTLPEGTFLMVDGSIEPNDKSNSLPELPPYNVYQMKGLVDMPADQVSSRFEGVLSDLGIKFKGKEFPDDLWYGVGGYKVLVNPAPEGQGTKFNQIDFTVYRYKDLGGWTFFRFGTSIVQ
jgi:hypothetical protein